MNSTVHSVGRVALLSGRGLSCAGIAQTLLTSRPACSGRIIPFLGQRKERQDALRSLERLATAYLALYTRIDQQHAEIFKQEHHFAWKRETNLT